MNRMKEFKIKIERTAKSIVEAIRFYELEFGENYLEYNDFFPNSEVLYEFAVKNGFITEKHYNKWRASHPSGRRLFTYPEVSSVIFDDSSFYGFDEDKTAIRLYDESSTKSYDEQYEDALLIYGALVVSREEYYQEFLYSYKGDENVEAYVEVLDEDSLNTAYHSWIITGENNSRDVFLWISKEINRIGINKKYKLEVSLIELEEN